MLKDVEWSEDGTYTPQGSHTPVEFFNNALKNSYLFDLELGYFNSAAISVLASSFATFIRNGGIMRMAINNIVSKKDKRAIEEGEEGNVDIPFDITDVDELRKNLDEYGEHFFHCLAYLIQEHKIQIRIIKPKGTEGISHTKRGQFSDGDTIISFTGSANFTLGGFFNNREEISLSFSDSPDPHVQKRIANRKEEFDKLMIGNDETVEYLSTSDLEEAIVSKFGKQEIEDLLEVEKKLKSYKLGYEQKHVLSEDLHDRFNKPYFPYGKPRDYQQLAYEKWKEKNLEIGKTGQKGLFAMATGTGKTITSLNCLLEIYNHNHYYKCIILVPTVTLVEQWEKECKKFNFNRIIKISSKNHSWRSDLSKLLISERLAESSTDNNYIIISTYASFVNDELFSQLNSLPRKQVLLIADEAHNMGAPLMKKKLPYITAIRRIGLSATPHRQFDFDGNKAIEDFFNVASDYYTFEYSMDEAIKNGILCRYYYYPHLVELTNEEMTTYQELTEKISKYLTVNHDSFKDDPILTALLLKRKRIVHKAANKEIIFKQILDARIKETGNLKYTLVYVPEGNEPDSESYEYSTKDTSENNCFDHLIDKYTALVRDSYEQITVREFTSNSKDRDIMLRQFADGSLDVLTSMKCLDEGVDVPRSEMAIFCSSTGNPRQFIQRRGRILRTHKDKHIAIIHDLVVAPLINGSEASFQTEKNLLHSELKRVQNFALLSENSNDSIKELNDVINFYNLSIFDV